MRLLVGLCAVLLLAACQPQSQDSGGAPLPLCVPGFHAGQTLTLRLGEVYDATSDYLYDASFLRNGAPSCNGADGLTVGATVTFDLETELPPADVSAWGFACAPLGSFNPQTLISDDDLTTARIDPETGITIAAAFTETQVIGMNGYSTLGLYTPSQNPNEPLMARELPPLVVSRQLDTQGFRWGCFDAWVATWVTGP